MQTAPSLDAHLASTDALHQPIYGIHRIEHGDLRSPVWQVTLQRQNRIYTRKFSDRRYGGPTQALHAAQLYRDSILAEYPPMTRRAQCAILKKSNRSGVSGVTRSVVTVTDRRSKTARSVVYWVARWPGEGRIATQRRFSVKKFGEWGAFLKAVEARRHGLACLEELPSNHPPI